MKPEGVTTQVKALNEYILMILFVFLLRSVFFFSNWLGSRIIYSANIKKIKQSTDATQKKGFQNNILNEGVRW